MLKIAIVTNTLAPYRTPVFSALAAMPGIAVCVIACTEREPNRQWDYPPLACEQMILRPMVIHYRSRYIHSNFDVFRALRLCDPDVVVTDGFNPTHLYAFAYALHHGLAHVAMTDGTDISERSLTFVHRMVRRFVYARTQSYVAASGGGLALFDRYRLPGARRHLSRLCVDNHAYTAVSSPKQYDLIFCGRMEAVKNPGFVLDLAVELGKRLQRRIRVLFVGSGTLEQDVRRDASLFPGLVDASFAGFATQQSLPQLYASARLFVFPTSWDPWGVVANEACATGLPILVTPQAGVANELVRDGENGYVCELDLLRWADHAELLLTQEAVWQRFSERSRAIVSEYTFLRAAEGLAQACRQATVLRRAESSGERAYVSRPRVLIVERQLLNYRTGFYNRLRDLLAAEGIELQLLVGEGTLAEKMKRNEAELPWAEHIPTHYLSQSGLCWQPFGRQARNADLVIVMHENKILYNLWLLFGSRPKRLAFWGHGANMQSDRPNGWRERFKRWTVGKADWWFAYTELSARLLANAFPPERTTVVENAVDVEEMIATCGALDVSDLAARRAALGMGAGKVGLYLGSLYKEKRLDFLLAAAQRIRQRLPDFQLLIVGAGPMEAELAAATAGMSWVHMLGALTGRAKCEAMMLADVILNPGLVGLGILDSFASGRPMFTTDCGLHSPEIAYLRNGENGIMTANSEAAYADAVTAVLERPAELARLASNARASAARYTVGNMAERMCEGIKAAMAIH